VFAAAEKTASAGGSAGEFHRDEAFRQCAGWSGFWTASELFGSERTSGRRRERDGSEEAVEHRQLLPIFARGGFRGHLEERGHALRLTFLDDTARELREHVFAAR
jgi:hypothetical protein